MASSSSCDVFIIGAGAAGMMCAARAAQSGLRVVLLDHSTKVGEKIRISGGGRCNFTNLNLNHGDPSAYYLSQNPRFVRHALARFTPNDFLALLHKHGIGWHEKHKGQLFCDRSAQDIVAMLQNECADGGVHWLTGTTVETIVHNAGAPYPFTFQTASGAWQSRFLVVATGGLAAPAIGATAFGYEIAKQFGHQIIAPQAALVPLRFADWESSGFPALSGISLPVQISCGKGRAKITFNEDLLFRHKGLSGPAVLQISSYWQPGQTLTIDLFPENDLSADLCRLKNGSKVLLKTALKQLCPTLPERLTDHWLAQAEFAPYSAHKWADVPDRILQALGHSLNAWTVRPSGSDGHKKAEVTRGGVDVRELSPKTMESKHCNGLYFIGEVCDITGWLGGYNFQWAWASAVCAAEDLKHSNAQ
ncbi:MAG: NAD(P)/FAD-dependent oxidoreductase, partial [Neisseria sp.]|nr:NAD(P)/FAD-dependent oxidoreductase [Neisseria sp.]